MNKALSTLAIAVVTALLAACGPKNLEENGSSNATTGTKGNISVTLLTQGSGIDDKSFNELAWHGITRFYGDTPDRTDSQGKFYKYIHAATQDMQTPNAKMAADEAPNLVVAAGFTYAPAIERAALAYPKQNFALIDAEVNAPNVYSALFSEQEASYLVGVAAALKAKADGVVNPKFAFLGGIPGAVLTRFEVGYAQGILSVTPSASIVDYYANDWGRPDLGKTQAKTWYDSGIYCIFAAAGGTGNGVIAQAKEYRLQGKNVWAIGVDSDQFKDGEYAPGKSAVLTSAVKRVDVALGDVLKNVKNNSFKGGVGIYNLAKGGVDFSISNPDLDISIVNSVNAMKSDIVSGKKKIFATYSEALTEGAAPAGLKAKDD